MNRKWQALYLARLLFLKGLGDSLATVVVTGETSPQAINYQIVVQDLGVDIFFHIHQPYPPEV